MTDISTYNGGARTADGYTLYEQADGSYTDGDLTFTTAKDLLLAHPDAVFFAPVFKGFWR